MVFSSIPFLFFFFPLFLILYFVVPFKLKNIILLIFSLIFYAWGEPVYIILMIISSILDYTNGRLLTKFKDKKKRKIVLIESIIANLFLLSFFKYSDFVIENINYLFKCNIDLLNLPLPIGISFFTFQTMSYTIDVYRGEVNAEKNFLNFMTYVCMFPQLIAGPIVRYETISKELHQREISFDNFSLGMMRFLKGLFKKVLIANTVGALWLDISTNFNMYSKLTLILGAIAYTFQIYYDFSGYSDMAIGMGKMLGFNYLENFNYPYISKSITEFWRRWHMSLSSFFKDYVYIPLGGNKQGLKKQITNIFIVWILTGIWHGASWNFIIWGLYFGIILLLEKVFLLNILKKIPKLFQHLYALILIIFGWIIFAFTNLSELKLFLGKLVSNSKLSGIDFNYFIRSYGIILIIACIFSSNIPSIIHKKIINSKIRSIYYPLLGITIVILFIVSISYLVSDTYNPFLYFRF